MRWAWLFLVVPIFSAWGKEATPSILYLTLWKNPAHAMRIHWHTPREEATLLAYRPKGEYLWQWKEGSHAHLLQSKVRVHTIELEDLEADTEYEFRLAEEVHRFRTLPFALGEGVVRFAVGGDAYFYLDYFQQMNARIAACDPAFVVVGGDIAYTCGWRGSLGLGSSATKRWHTFLKEWRRSMVAPDGRLIPLVPVVGNHDVCASTAKNPGSESLFYEIFAFPLAGRAFRVLDVGNYLSLFLLDTGHSTPVAGQQAQWLEQNLSRRENTPYKIAAYHVAGYPSYYPYSQGTPLAIRREWGPLFERYHLQCALEHHNHAYKRTYPLKAGKVDPDGLVYMGDGSWGVKPRGVSLREYLERVESKNAVCIVTLKEEGGEIEAMGLEGEKIDALAIFPASSSTPLEERRLLRR
ncbi:MAG TPA: metallophosphoesterase family protein [Rhabdochlamydiaceae bacterium]|jgi:hypothetical protein